MTRCRNPGTACDVRRRYEIEDPVEALARVTVGIVARFTDIGLEQPLPRSTIRPNDQVVVSWDWVWPKGDAWSVSVWVELHTPHGYGGYRIPIKERNVQDNRAYVRVRRPNRRPKRGLWIACCGSGVGSCSRLPRRPWRRGARIRFRSVTVACFMLSISPGAIGLWMKRHSVRMSACSLGSMRMRAR